MRSALLYLASAFASAAGVASAHVAPDSPPLRIRDVQIAKHGPSPTPQMKPARLQGGAAVVVCKVVKASRLDDCIVESETPEGADVGRTVIRNAKGLRLKPLALDGTPIDGRKVRLGMVFRSGKFGEALHCPKADLSDPTRDDPWYICTWRP